MADTDPAALGLRAAELPACFVECGQAYHRRGLWEIEQEMYARATEALKIPLPDTVRPFAEYTRRALTVNRLESAAAHACALVEVGQRDAARDLAVAVQRPTAAERAGLAPIWALEVRTLECLLDAIVEPADVDDSL